MAISQYFYHGAQWGSDWGYLLVTHFWPALSGNTSLTLNKTTMLRSDNTGVGLFLLYDSYGTKGRACVNCARTWKRTYFPLRKKAAYNCAINAK